MNLKSLLKDTAIYGMSSIVGRFLNYLLVPVYTYCISAQSGGYGVVTNLYAYTAFFLALLTFGMETTLFRFGSKKEEDDKMVYSTALRMVGAVALAFFTVVVLLQHPIADTLGYAAHPEYIACFAAITALDAFQAIMFSRLRQQRRPIRFVALKFAFIIPSILLNLFIFLVLKNMPSAEWMFDKFNGGAGLIFFTNLACTLLVTFLFIPEMRGIGYGWDRGLAKRMLRYSIPLMILSLVGILNQVADKMLFPKLMPGEDGMIQLGIYGACVKIAMIMSLLTQAFRYAYEPIVFSDSKDRNSPQTLADGMKYFIVFTLLAYIAVIFYMPVLKYFVGKDYWDGLGVVPIVMLAEIFMGVYFNLSFWYKLTDKTWWGALISAIGAAVMIIFNIIFVPRIGYWACAWGGLIGYGTAMVLSFLIGRGKYPVKYDYKVIGGCVGLTILLIAVSKVPSLIGVELPTWATLCLNTVLLGIYCLPWGIKLIKSRRI
ncbi:MAG TPA: polysaccharide biosynthesis protein [Rikenellaceae bacterium]|nr:polysaccharide biosynthesis protein [Rikenellaceae bacterium]